MKCLDAPSCVSDSMQGHKTQSMRSTLILFLARDFTFGGQCWQKGLKVQALTLGTVLESVAFFQGIIVGCKTCSVSSGGWVCTCNKTWKLKAYMGKDSLAYVISVLSPENCWW